MAYTKMITTAPTDLLLKLRAYAEDCGWHVLVESDDLALDESGDIDGKRLVLQSPSLTTYASLRSANGGKIFPSGGSGTGLGLTCAAGFTEYPASGLWYDQPGVTKAVSQEVIGVGIPVQKEVEQNVYFNHISQGAEMIVISLEVIPGVFQHMAFGEAEKIGSWTGGALYSASRGSSNMFAGFSQTALETGSNHLFGMSMQASTFLRCDIDAAPLRLPEVLWASGGQNTGGAANGWTGKMLALPSMNLNCLKETWLPKVPHYGYLQSQDSTDTGRNVNTLNCISVNLPLALYVQRDPDALMNFSQCGYVPGVYFISTRNVAPAQTYKVNYPTSDTEYQAFPQTRRGGVMGYDGIAILQ